MSNDTVSLVKKRVASTLCSACSEGRGQLLSVALYALVALALLAPMASDTILPGAPDHANHVALIIQAKMGLDEGQFPLRVAPWQHNGWRYPVYQFYSPFPYTIAGLIYKWVTPSNPFAAYKLMIWLSLSLAGFFLYHLALFLTKSRPASLLAGAAYITAPYFLITSTHAGRSPRWSLRGLSRLSSTRASYAIRPPGGSDLPSHPSPGFSLRRRIRSLSYTRRSLRAYCSCSRQWREITVYET